MPAKDLYHDTVKAALENDGWTITHDPLTLRWGKKDLFVDLGAERLLAAEREGRKIAVEVKSFLGRSEMDDLENALGQYVLYYKILQRTEPDRDIYLAVQELTFIDVFQEDVGRLLLEDKTLQLLVFDVATQEIVRWIP
jgi:XisH protein